MNKLTHLYVKPKCQSWDLKGILLLLVNVMLTIIFRNSFHQKKRKKNENDSLVEPTELETNLPKCDLLHCLGRDEMHHLRPLYNRPYHGGRVCT